MSNTVHTLEWQGKNGVIRLEASYQAMLQEKTNNLDGDICYTGKLEIIERASLTAYFNDKQLDSGWNPASWFLVESPVPGVYQIRDVPKIGIQTEMREKVRQFLEDTIAQGTPVSVQAFRLDHELKQTMYDLESYQNTLKEIKAQKDLPTRQEARRRMKAYNDLYNEGGEGYVPHIYCTEERDYAVDQIAMCLRNSSFCLTTPPNTAFIRSKKAKLIMAFAFSAVRIRKKWVSRCISAIMTWCIVEI